MNGRRRQMEELVEKLKDAGLDVDPAGGHYKVTHPEQQGLVVLASTPSDYRAVKNARARVKRMFKVEIK